MVGNKIYLALIGHFYFMPNCLVKHPECIKVVRKKLTCFGYVIMHGSHNMIIKSQGVSTKSIISQLHILDY